MCHEDVNSFLTSKLHILSFLAGKRGRYSYEKKCQYALKSGEMKRSKIQKIPPQLQPIEDEVVVLATRLSEVFLSNSTYPENYFENITPLRTPTKARNLTLSLSGYFFL